MTIVNQLSSIAAVMALSSFQPQPTAQPTTKVGEQRAALVSELTGTATVRLRASAKPSKVDRFASLPAGAVLTVGRQSRAVLVLAAGNRFALGADARATVHADRLSATSGAIDELPALPPLPKLVALDASAPKTPGGVRLRATVISGLSPASGSAIASSTVLRFNSVSGAATYRVEIEDDQGRVIFGTDARSPQVQVPGDVLQAGASYYWTVRTLDRPGAQAKGSAEFRTLRTEELKAREDLRRTLQDGNASSVALLAAIDQHLGLHYDALQGFRAALVHTPGDESLHKAIKQLEDALRASGPG